MSTFLRKFKFTSLVICLYCFSPAVFGQAVLPAAVCPPPVISAGGPVSICGAGTVTLSSSAAANNLWSNGATSQSITTDTSGVFTVQTITDTCTSAPSLPVVVTISTAPATPFITVVSGGDLCTGVPLILESSSAAGNVWSNGERGQRITVTESGSFWVQVVSGACTSALSQTIPLTFARVETPVISLAGPSVICGSGSVALISSSLSGNIWSNGSTESSISVSDAGVYTVRVVSGSCTSAASEGVTISVNPVPAAPVISPAGRRLICVGGNITFSAGPADAYLWSNGSASPTITVSDSGKFTVRTVIAGCTSAVSDTVYVNINSIPAPQIDALDTTEVCAGGTVTLYVPGVGEGPSGPSSYGYLWSNGETRSSLTVSNTGFYSLRYVYLGCTSAISNIVEVNILPALPQPVVRQVGNTNLCEGSTATLTTGNADAWLWSNGATTQRISVTQIGFYTVRFISGGCTSAASEPVGVSFLPRPARPFINVVSVGQPCKAVLSTAPAEGYLWSNGETTQTISVNSGEYVSLQVSAAGCLSLPSDTLHILFPRPVAPVAIASGPIHFCRGDSVILSTTNPTGTWWNGSAAPNGSITVKDPGVYYTYYNLGACQSDSVFITVTVTELPPAPQVTASGPLVFCHGDSVILTSDKPSGNFWSTGATTQSLKVTEAGTYYVNTLSNECMGPPSAEFTVTVHSPAKPSITGQNDTLYATPGGVSYTWYNANGALPGFNTNKIPVLPGASFPYTVNYTDVFGCTSPMSDEFEPGAASAGLHSVTQLVPNPALASFRIEGIKGRQAICISNMLGQAVWSGTADEGTVIHVGQLPAGLYTVYTPGKTFRLLVGSAY
ncbi:MAG: hypothetical protein V4543_09470 [Bacteroidota bacterium]